MKQNVKDDSPFLGIEQFEAESAGYAFRFPTFFPEVLHFQVSFLAPLEALQRLLPSSRMKPLRLLGSKGVLNVGVLSYRRSDIGEYDEVAFTIPVLLGDSGSLVRALSMGWPPFLAGFVWQLPVTTQHSLHDGVDFYGFPKFLAEIDIVESGRWARCRLVHQGQEILELTLRRPGLHPAGRAVVQLLSLRNGHLLRSEAVVNQRCRGLSLAATDVQLRLGPHPLGRQLSELELGRPLLALYFPDLQLTMSSPLESYPVDSQLRSAT